jgi:hypothetical protein
MRLIGVQFNPGVSVSVGGKHTAITYWDREKLPEIACDEQQDGSLIIYWRENPRLKRKVRPWSIAWSLHEEIAASKVELGRDGKPVKHG